MKATGLFFLRAHANTALDAKQERVLLLDVLERDPADSKVILNTLLAVWKGREALQFFEAHHHELRAGRPLELEIDRLRGHDGQWRAQVTACRLAPLAPSWRVKDEQPLQASPAQPEHH